MKKKHRCPEEDACELYQIAFFAFYERVITGKLTHLQYTIKTYLFKIGINQYYGLQKDHARYEHDINEK